MNVEPLILAVETATLAGSIALVRGSEAIATSSGDPAVSHSNTLLADLDKLLSGTTYKLADIDLFAVAAGPGSFTGLRIGIATVKALAATLDRSCAAIPTLHAVALAGGVAENSVALLPAGRGEVFAQLFSVSADDAVTALDEPSHISPQKMIDKYGSLEKVLWCGAGALAQRELIEGSAAGKQWRIASRTENLAQQVAALALRDCRQDRLVAPDALQAIYVRPSDAELKVS
ncbi:MAG TPA: tRNA (adenosine(37)-N6)-threonylcarbamoyltransferase complex dimerization subunit type 1 TsaB [Pyrinomonadaceae bacterium]|nr:tRNA (adenosine(37)-N6)-threonylcarbamoyltransferase complex dimerization subunit type 1 TsaB [Pyrinomonadaceae bacterium]